VTEPSNETGALAAHVARAIRDVPDFPKKGILFKDITPLLGDPGLFARTTTAMAAPFALDGITHVVAIESRGFLFGGPIAQRLAASLVPVRKAGKLPHTTRRVSYDLEYGTDHLEMHEDALTRGARVLVVDDVLATGGTARAVCSLVEELGGTVAGCSFLVALAFLPGLEALRDRRVSSIVQYR
jgi:adenine phosphoribosyltransferase